MSGQILVVGHFPDITGRHGVWHMHGMGKNNAHKGSTSNEKSHSSNRGKESKIAIEVEDKENY